MRLYHSSACASRRLPALLVALFLHLNLTALFLHPNPGLVVFTSANFANEYANANANANADAIANADVDANANEKAALRQELQSLPIEYLHEVLELALFTHWMDGVFVEKFIDFANRAFQPTFQFNSILDHTPYSCYERTHSFTCLRAVIPPSPKVWSFYFFLCIPTLQPMPHPYAYALLYG